MRANKSILDGIVRKPRFRGGRNPAPHSPLAVQNRVLIDVVGPEGLKKHVEHDGNILTQYGLNRLSEMLASDAGGASAWMNYLGVGNDTTAADSTDSGIGSTFGTGTLGGATVNRSDKTDYTAEYQATFSDTVNARTIEEVCLCQTDTYDASGGARSVLGEDSVGKGTADTVYLSYQFIAGTAA
ncbi:MAG TPA: hypothetical protein VNA25_22935 [Phycisphaerae bacterium]|nr:hypothetical protein [Phycisphaerae bacterium]